jgi:hypothetical protein
MTCFWNSLLHGIPKDSYDEGTMISRPIELVEYLKKRNCKTDHVRLNGVLLNEMRKSENMEAISCLDSNSIYHGYLCAFEEPFLFLVCELCKINIHHNYNGHIAHYIYEGTQRCMYLQSNPGHMNFLYVRH